MPQEFVAFGESFQRFHPDWEMKLWTEANIPPLRNQVEFDGAETLAQKADILRYEILLDHGGVYIDTDFECLRSIDTLIKDCRAFSATEDTQWISIGIMGAVPGYPLFQAVVDELPAALRSRPTAAVNEQTGPLFFTKVVTGRRLKGLDSDFRVFEPKLFYPYTVGQQHLRAGPFPDAYAVHHWAGSWLGAGKKESGEPVRVLLGFDPERPQAALAVLLAYQRLFGPSDPVELGIYAYAEPSLPLLECVQLLMRNLVGDPAHMAAISLLSRAELGELSYRSAYFPSGDEFKDAIQLSSVLSVLHAVKVRLHGAVCRLDRADDAPSRHEILAWAARRPAERISPPKEEVSSAVGEEGGRRRGDTPGFSSSSIPSRDLQPGLFGVGLGDGRVLTKTIHGYPIVSPAEDLSLTPELVLHGVYDLPLSRFIEARLAPGQIAFDVGANIGLFTVAMARAVGETGHVVAYEAVPENYQYLLDNVGMNYLSQWCTLRRQAAWSKSEKLSFWAPRKFRGNGSLRMAEQEYIRRYPGDELSTIEVDAVPLQPELERFESVSLVKVDVEGAEFQVLLGMEPSLRSGRIKAVVFECLASLLGEDFTPLLRWLKKLEQECGLRCWTLDREGGLASLGLDTLERVGNFTQVVLTRAG